MASLNRVTLLGNLGADPELRHTQGGTAVTTLRIATTDVRNGPNGERQEFTEWHNVVVWQKQAENCAKYLSKGRQVMVEGRLQTRSWEDKDGQKRYTTEIVAHNVQFISDGKSQGQRAPHPGDSPQQGGGQHQQQQAYNPETPQSHFGGPDTPGLDDIPF